MTDDKEERLITWETVHSWLGLNLDGVKKTFASLPLAPKHTDEEYNEVAKAAHKMYDNNFALQCRVEELQARIKELEILASQKLDYQPNCTIKFQGVDEDDVIVTVAEWLSNTIQVRLESNNQRGERARLLPGAGCPQCGYPAIRWKT